MTTDQATDDETPIRLEIDFSRLTAGSVEDYMQCDTYRETIAWLIANTELDEETAGKIPVEELVNLPPAIFAGVYRFGQEKPLGVELAPGLVASDMTTLEESETNPRAVIDWFAAHSALSRDEVRSLPAYIAFLPGRKVRAALRDQYKRR